ncbi:hypothetical protein [Stieleria varia]|uniref:Uncharacterized protein n=1 Tax=Stieleria varia TaxID=2528005 RepID=A0A5C6B754_9BACT|nr:hypothetical protein [Stieleria varia]TWU07818.1 hypothetical protein Pla52n_03930 [Stieleria varia]
MKRIACALLLLACTCPPSHAQEHPIGNPAAKTLAGDAAADDSDAAPQEDSDNELVENANSDRHVPASADANVTLKRLQLLVGNWADVC